MKTLAYVVGGAAVLLALSNWKKCSAASYVTDQTGRRLADGSACPAPGTCNIVATTRTPDPSCLFNPFPGGL